MMRANPRSADADRDEDILEEKLFRLLAREAQGEPVRTGDVPGGRIFIRNRPPVTLFLILQRPKLESLRALEHVRNHLPFETRVVVIAPPLSSELKMQMLDQGVTSYLEQPVQEGQLERLIEDLSDCVPALHAGG